jgi:hypothetical protein
VLILKDYDLIRCRDQCCVYAHAPSVKDLRIPYMSNALWQGPTVWVAHIVAWLTPIAFRVTPSNTVFLSNGIR